MMGYGNGAETLAFHDHHCDEIDQSLFSSLPFTVQYIDIQIQRKVFGSKVCGGKNIFSEVVI